jgi:IS5 family transposase
MMAQLTFSDFEKDLQRKKSRKAEFLELLDRLVPWASLIALIEPYYPKVPDGCGRRPYALDSMIRIYIMQLCYNLSDPMMENELIDSVAMRKFSHLGSLSNPTPDETTILNFRHLLERHSLCEQFFDLFNEHLIGIGVRISRGTIIDATIIEALCSIKNKQKQRDPEAKHTKKGNPYHFGMKAHIGVDADSGIVHSIAITGANVADISMADDLIRDNDDTVLTDAGYQGLEKHEKTKGKAVLVAMRPGKRKLLSKNSILSQIEYLKSQVRAKVEHPFHWLKCIFGLKKLRYRGLYKNAQMLYAMFGLINLCQNKKLLINSGA